MSSLTERGVGYTLSILPLGVAVSRAILSPLNADEQALFLALLKRVAEGAAPISAAHPSR